MSIGVYPTLGVFLMIASRNPYAHMEIIWSGKCCITWRFWPKRCGPHAAAALSAALLMYSLHRDDKARRPLQSLRCGSVGDGQRVRGPVRETFQVGASLHDALLLTPRGIRHLPTSRISGRQTRIARPAAAKPAKPTDTSAAKGRARISGRSSMWK
jgi:hypothetical protein